MHYDDNVIFGQNNESVTRKLTPEERCVASIPSHSKQHCANINFIFDRSKSMTDESLQVLFDNGVCTMLKLVQANATSANLRLNIRITAFNQRVVTLMDWVPIRSALEGWKSVTAPKASGATRIDLALRDGIDAIDRMKQQHDKRFSERQDIPKRAGSMVFLVTDGENTGDDGYVTALPDTLVQEIAERQGNGSTAFLSLGLGPKVNEESLVKLAPPYKGVSRSAMYGSAVGSNTSDLTRFWTNVASIIAQGSTHNLAQADRPVGYYPDEINRESLGEILVFYGYDNHE